MAVIVEKWPEESIVIIRPDALASEAELIDAWRRGVRVARDNMHRIVDLSASPSPEKMAAIIRRVARTSAGASPQPNVILVGKAMHPDSSEIWYVTLEKAVESVMEHKSAVRIKVS